MAAVEVAGGQLEVMMSDRSVQLHAVLSLTALSPDQARRLAICLLEAAQDAERPEPPAWP